MYAWFYYALKKKIMEKVIHTNQGERLKITISAVEERRPNGKSYHQVHVWSQTNSICVKRVIIKSNENLEETVVALEEELKSYGDPEKITGDELVLSNLGYE